MKKSEQLIDFITGVFQPVIPAFAGAGMVKAVLDLLIVFKIITNDSQTYYLLSLFADGVFYFMPMLLAFTTAQKLKCNIILALSIAAMMMHPNWDALVNTGEAIHFFNVIPFTLTTYTSTVIPIILIIVVQSYIENYLYKWVPKTIALIFVPMLTFLIMGTLAFSVVGPIGNFISNALAGFFTFLSIKVSWAPALLIGTLFPVMVLFGVHNGVAPLGIMQIADLGYDSIFGPGCLCSNMAQATAGAVVALRTKNKETKQLATSGAITAYMGVSNPLLYSITLPKKYPLMGSMIGGSCGGLYAGLMQIRRFASGSSGIPDILLYIGDDTMIYFYNMLIAMVISIIVSAVVTFILSFRYEQSEQDTLSVIEDKAA